MNLPKKYIQRLRNKNGIYPKKINIDVDEFIRLYDNLGSSYKVADALDVSDSYVKKFAREIGYEPDNERKIPQDVEFAVIADYKNNIKNEVIYDKYNISQTSLYRILTRNNIDRNKDKKVYNIDETVFDVIDSGLKAYLIGFIAADGYISEECGYIKITINKKDEQILEIFRTGLKTNTPIRYITKHKDGKVYEYAYIVIVNKRLVERLNAIGLRQRKTWGNTIPDINEEYFHDFIRGYFDGDGCVTNAKPNSIDVSISGFESNIRKIIDRLEQINIFATFIFDKRKYNTDENTGRFGALGFTNNTQRYCFLKWIYENDNGIHLDRKYLLAKQFIADVEANPNILYKQAVIYYKHAVCGVG